MDVGKSARAAAAEGKRDGRLPLATRGFAYRGQFCSIATSVIGHPAQRGRPEITRNLNSSNRLCAGLRRLGNAENA